MGADRRLTLLEVLKFLSEMIVLFGKALFEPRVKKSPGGHQLRHMLRRNDGVICGQILSARQNDASLAIRLRPAQTQHLVSLRLHHYTRASIREALGTALEDVHLPADFAKEYSCSQTRQRAANNCRSFHQRQTLQTSFSHCPVVPKICRIEATSSSSFWAPVATTFP